jgi:hypothetical protein
MTEEMKPPEVETPEKSKTRTFSDELEVAGNQLVERVQELVKEGNARRIILRNQEGEVLMDINLTVGAVVGGVAMLAAWWLAPLAAVAAVFARIKVEIVREEPTE